MSSRVIFGFVLGVALVGVWIVAPRLNPASPPQIDEAVAQAELARRQMQRYSPMMTVAAARSSLDELKNADFDQLAAAAQRLNDEDRAAAEAADREPPQPSPASAGALRAGVSGFEGLLAANRALLDSALQNARAALAAAGQAPVATPGLIAGNAQMLAAETLLVEATQLRRALEEQYAQALKLSTRYRLTAVKGSYYEDLQIEPIIADLETGARGQSWAMEQLAAARVRVENLQAQVDQRRETLANVAARLADVQAERAALSDAGFAAGDDEAFAVFRNDYQRLSDELRTLELREQSLRFGVRADAQFADGDIAAGALTGGEREPGLIHLERALEVEQLRAARFERAVSEIGQRIAEVRVAAENAAEERSDYNARLKETRAKLETLVAQLDQTAAEAAKKELAALQAAQSARSAYGQAARAISAWKAAARETRQKYDPERQNPRLTLIDNDRYSPLLGDAGAAAARLLEGRIHAQRVDGLSRHLDALTRVTELVGGEIKEEAKLRDALAAARKEGVDTLNAAVELYERLAGGPSNTAWTAQAALGATYYLLSKIDTGNEQQLAYQAAQTLQQAVEGRSDSPYLAAAVRFRDYLVVTTGYAPPAEPTLEEAPGEPAPAEPPPAQDEF